MTHELYNLLNQFIIDNQTNERIVTTFKSRFTFITGGFDHNYVIYAHMRDKLVHQYIKYCDLFSKLNPPSRNKYIKQQEKMIEVYKKLLTGEIKYIFLNNHELYIEFIMSKRCFLSRLILKMRDPNPEKVEVTRKTITAIHEVVESFPNIHTDEVKEMFDHALRIPSFADNFDVNGVKLLTKIISYGSLGY